MLVSYYTDKAELRALEGRSNHYRTSLTRATLARSSFAALRWASREVSSATREQEKAASNASEAAATKALLRRKSTHEDDVADAMTWQGNNQAK